MSCSVANCGPLMPYLSVIESLPPKIQHRMLQVLRPIRCVLRRKGSVLNDQKVFCVFFLCCPALPALLARPAGHLSVAGHGGRLARAGKRISQAARM